MRVVQDHNHEQDLGLLVCHSELLLPEPFQIDPWDLRGVLACFLLFVQMVALASGVFEDDFRRSQEDFADLFGQ